MNAERLLATFSMIGDDSDRIQQLRKIAVALAISGKLDARHESLRPAQILEAIDRAKAALVQREALSKQNKRSEIAEEDLPEGFTNASHFAPLGELARIEKGKTRIQQARPGPFPLVVTAAERTSCEHYDFEDAAAIIPLVSSTGHGNASLNRLHYQDGQFALGTILAGIFPHDPSLISARFLFEYLSAFKEELLVSRMTGTANVTLTVGSISHVPIPLVCPDVQKKLDELMALCDRLEAARTAREATRDRLAVASLARLNAPDPETFHEDAQFVLHALPAVTTRPDQMNQFRQTILNLAVRGKLVPQDRNDEPVTDMLRKAIARRAALVKAKKVRAKKLDDLDDLVAGTDLPAGWALERLGNLVDPENTISYGVLVPGEEVPDGIPFVRAQDLALSGHPDRPNKTISPEIEKTYARTRLRGGEILVCVVGSIGKLGIVPQSWAGANIARAVARVLPIPEISREYLLTVLRGEPVQKYFTETTRTLAQPTLNVGLIERTPIPLPPLAEQHRIVAKVDELMALCDRLEASLTETSGTRRRLLDALLAEALEPATVRVMEAAE